MVYCPRLCGIVAERFIARLAATIDLNRGAGTLGACTPPAPIGEAVGCRRPLVSQCIECRRREGGKPGKPPAATDAKMGPLPGQGIRRGDNAMKEFAIADGITEIELDSWAEFFNLAKFFGLERGLFATAPAFIYRGQANYSWPLRSSLDRLEERFPKCKNLGGENPEFADCPPFTEEEHLKAFRNAIRGRRGTNPPHLSDDDCWALGQHHGLATPLLDWTRSPFVALFFAFEEEQVVLDGKLTDPEYRGVFALSTRTIPAASPSSTDRVAWISPNSDANYRLISQAALFVKVPRHAEVERNVRTHFAGETHAATYTKIKIRNQDRDGCLVALSKMNINHMTLFPDIDGAAKHVNSLWQPGHEDSIAFV
jgi:hypothetical protein